ncbi:hypothetical protein F5J12DRAFT_722917, partial [Pisolithus orientalis]|uniref:uncharacterized protein n=1 Tax=Pisolithus orientalis TaxID=936130 RepID=UPI0022243A67
PTFLFICWNIIQKREASDNVTFSIKSAHQNELAAELHEMADCVCEYAKKCLTVTVPKPV